MQPNKSIYIRLLFLTIFIFVAVVSIASPQHGESLPGILQEELLTEEEEKCYTATSFGLKTNAGFRMMPARSHDAQKRMVNVAEVIVRSCQPNAFSASPPADKCHLYCIYRL